VDVGNGVAVMITGVAGNAVFVAGMVLVAAGIDVTEGTGSAVFDTVWHPTSVNIEIRAAGRQKHIYRFIIISLSD
jgi:hypothetical protein